MLPLFFHPIHRLAMSAVRFPVHLLFFLRSSLRVCGLLLVLAGWTSCARAEGALTVFAAASLQTALDQIATEWQAQGHAKPALAYAGTPTLAQQIDKGAPADLLISADPDWMEWLISSNHINKGKAVPLLGNSLVLIAAAGQQAPVIMGPAFDLAALLGPSRLAMAEPRTVPAGKYGKAALEHLGLWDKVAASVAPVDNVRMALNLVARREAKLGIVYRSDAAAEPRVSVIGRFTPESHPPIVYPAAVLNRSTHPDAQAFLDFLQGPQARKRFEDAGFSVLTGPKP